MHLYDLILMFSITEFQFWMSWCLFSHYLIAGYLGFQISVLIDSALMDTLIIKSLPASLISPRTAGSKDMHIFKVLTVL